MSDTSTGNHNGAGWYEIRLKGHLDSRWAAWFDGLSLSRPSRPPESSHREQRRAHPKARRCSHAHQEPRGDCRATRGGHIATETGQAEDRRPVEPSGIGSITAPLNIEREGPMSSTAPAAERIGRRRWRWGSSPPRNSW